MAGGGRRGARQRSAARPIPQEGRVSHRSLTLGEHSDSGLLIYKGCLPFRIWASSACPYMGVICSPIYGVHSLVFILSLYKSHLLSRTRESLARPYKGLIRLTVYGGYLLACVRESFARSYMGVICFPAYGGHLLAHIWASERPPYAGEATTPICLSCSNYVP